jgi:hypothetical protein
MAEHEPTVQFDREPLLFLDEAFPAGGDAVWLPGRQLCLSDPVVSKAVLANGEGLYEDHSDFFRIRRGTFGPRPVQVKIGREARTLLRAHVNTHKGELAESVRRALVPSSDWPDAGNWLMYRHLAAALLEPGSPVRLRRTVDEIVERAILAGARQRYSLLRRAVFRFRVERELVRAVEYRRKRGVTEPVDLLDVVVGAAGSEAPAEELAEVFLSCVFAIAGSLGFVLGWSLYLLGTNPHTDAEPAWVVREALRLWPVAWLLGARPAKRHEVAGVTVTPQDEVVVCPYVVQRNAKHWEEPATFRPERWASVKNPQAFIPFGWGPHTCPAALLSLELVEDVLRVIVSDYRLTVAHQGTRPHVTAALAPPRFTLSLVPRLS